MRARWQDGSCRSCDRSLLAARLERSVRLADSAGGSCIGLQVKEDRIDSAHSDFI